MEDNSYLKKEFCESAQKFGGFEPWACEKSRQHAKLCTQVRHQLQRTVTWKACIWRPFTEHRTFEKTMLIHRCSRWELQCLGRLQFVTYCTTTVVLKDLIIASLTFRWPGWLRKILGNQHLEAFEEVRPWFGLRGGIQLFFLDHDLGLKAFTLHLLSIKCPRKLLLFVLKGFHPCKQVCTLTYRAHKQVCTLSNVSLHCSRGLNSSLVMIHCWVWESYPSKSHTCNSVLKHDIRTAQSQAAKGLLIVFGEELPDFYSNQNHMCTLPHCFQTTYLPEYFT